MYHKSIGLYGLSVGFDWAHVPATAAELEEETNP